MTLVRCKLQPAMQTCHAFMLAEAVHDMCKNLHNSGVSGKAALQDKSKYTSEQIAMNIACRQSTPDTTFVPDQIAVIAASLASQLRVADALGLAHKYTHSAA